VVNHLIHVGFPKAGSKSLQRWFDRHPAFAFAQWGIAGAADAWRFEETFAFDTGARCAVTSYEGFASPVPDHDRLDFDDVAGLIPCRPVHPPRGRTRR
jgi:hypothetical protein